MKLTTIAFRTRPAPTRRQLPLSRPPSHPPTRNSSPMCVSRETCPDARNQAAETAKPGEKHPDRQQHTPIPGLSRGETCGPRAQQPAQTPRRPSKGHRLLIPCAMRGLSSNELLGEPHRVGLQAHVAVHHHTTPPQHDTERTHSLQHALHMLETCAHNLIPIPAEKRPPSQPHRRRKGRSSLPLPWTDSLLLGPSNSNTWPAPAAAARTTSDPTTHRTRSSAKHGADTSWATTRSRTSVQAATP
jgi:hypothetical protein